MASAADDNSNDQQKSEDPEMDALLDSVLSDFNKLKDAKPESSPPTTTKPKRDPAVEDFIKTTTQQFEATMRSMLANGAISPGDEIAKEDMVHLAESLSKNCKVNSSEGKDETDPEEMMMKELLGGSENIMPVLDGVLHNLLSKETLYPALESLNRKYPVWIREHEQDLRVEELARYQRQCQVVQRMCTEYEKQTEDDDDETNRKSFQTIMELMTKMQDCGQPPKELVGDAPALRFDDNGLPDMGSLPLDQNCSVM